MAQCRTAGGAVLGMLPAGGDGRPPLPCPARNAPMRRREVARMKEETWRAKEEHVESLWVRTVERNDRCVAVGHCAGVLLSVG